MLDEDALIKKLTEPKNALAKQYQKFFEMDNVLLEFTQDALKAVSAIILNVKLTRGLSYT